MKQSIVKATPRDADAVVVAISTQVNKKTKSKTNKTTESETNGNQTNDQRQKQNYCS